MNSGIIPPENFDAPTIAERTAYIPGGVRIAPREDSAEGVVVVPNEDCTGIPASDVRFRLRAGLLEDLAARTGLECLTGWFAQANEAGKMLGGIHIGLNPAFKIIDEGVGYRPQIARGVVYISFGQNVHIGGTSDASFYWLFPILNATIEVDGVVIMKDGRLTNEVGGEMER